MNGFFEFFNAAGLVLVGLAARFAFALVVLAAIAVPAFFVAVMVHRATRHAPAGHARR